LGTALTPDQVRLLKRYTKNVFLVYDGDAAGQNASLRSLDIFIDEDVSVRIAVLPPGYDPDSFIREQGVDAFKELLASAATIFEYKLRALTAKYDCGTSEGKAGVCAEILPTIKKFRSRILKSEYIRTLSEVLNVSERVLLEELKSGGAQRPLNAAARRIENAKPAKAKPLNAAELLLVRIVCNETSMLERITEQLGPQDYEDSRTAMIIDTMKRLVAEGKTVGPHTLMHYLDDTDAANIVLESAFTDEVDNRQKEKILSDCIARVKFNKERRLRGQIQDELRKAQKDGDEKKIQQLMERFSQLIKKGQAQ
jgi:DNA primase